MPVGGRVSGKVGIYSNVRRSKYRSFYSLQSCSLLSGDCHCGSPDDSLAFAASIQQNVDDPKTRLLLSKLRRKSSWPHALVIINIFASNGFMKQR